MYSLVERHSRSTIIEESSECTDPSDEGESKEEEDDPDGEIVCLNRRRRRACVFSQHPHHHQGYGDVHGQTVHHPVQPVQPGLEPHHFHHLLQTTYTGCHDQ